MNYIRFWQTSSENKKTPIRTKTSLGLLVEDGYNKDPGASWARPKMPPRNPPESCD